MKKFTKKQIAHELWLTASNYENIKESTCIDGVILQIKIKLIGNMQDTIIIVLGGMSMRKITPADLKRANILLVEMCVDSI